MQGVGQIKNSQKISVKINTCIQTVNSCPKRFCWSVLFLIPESKNILAQKGWFALFLTYENNTYGPKSEYFYLELPIHSLTVEFLVIETPTLFPENICCNVQVPFLGNAS